jgi:predicted ArsR family transcriptional regulator
VAVLPSWPNLPSKGTTPTTNIPVQSASEIGGLQITLDIPRGQVSQMMGLMNFLQQKYQKLNIQITATDGTMSDNELTDHIKETLKQLGINPEKAVSTRNQ